MGHYFVRYKREFVITVIVITEFDSIINMRDIIDAQQTLRECRQT
jgi:hypothetical protein